jgi:hypothetical protein
MVCEGMEWKSVEFGFGADKIDLVKMMVES